MSFNSTFFLFTFLPIAWLIASITPKTYRKYSLLVLSFIAYFWVEPIVSIVLLVLCIYCYVLSDVMMQVKKRKKQALMMELVVIVLFLLGYFKYYGFLLNSIGSIFQIHFTLKLLAVPTAISFISFTMISFVVDVYRGSIKTPLRLVDFLLYIFYFPKMIMGPLMRYEDFVSQLNEPIQPANTYQGIIRFIIGLAKKVILANTFAMIFTNISSMNDIGTLNAWLGALAFTFQIYFDFSGYSDMAVGISSLFGITLCENFHYPYTAISIKDFWKRWHISLSTWFKDYVYIPLGGSKCALPRVILNTFIVWALTGLWHGASWNFVLWGIYYFVLLMLERYILQGLLKRLPVVIRRTITFILIMFGWVLFAFPDVSELTTYISALFGANGFLDMSGIWYLKNHFMYFIIGFIAMTPIITNFYQANRTQRLDMIHDIMCILLLVLSIVYLVSSTFQPFLYTQF